ncbi:MAG: radical SAM/SPASM domain-containing protein [Planctomycetota bacterium]|jgi:radical SAM protein with 4Fe4S-binding SPASM domain
MNLSRKKISIIKNVVRALYNYKRKKVLLDNLPTVLWIEPTNKCNLKCIMCPNSRIPKDRLGFMDWHVYKKIIDEAKQFTSSAYLLLAGESLLHKDIYKMIRYTADNSIRPLVNTNGTTLTSKEKRIALLESGVKHITFAFDGYNKETYEKIRIGADYDKVVEGIIEFLKEKKNRRLREPCVTITTLEVGVEDYQSKADAKKQFHKLFDALPVDQFIAKTPNTWGGVFKDTNRFTHHQIDKNRFYPCSHLWSTMSICWDGTVVPCCFDFFNNYVLGNVKEKSLKDIWNDEPMLKLRRAMLDGTYHALDPICKDCVILYLDAILGVPAGMRTAVKDMITNFLGTRIEKSIVKCAKKIKPSYSLRIDN